MAGHTTNWTKNQWYWLDWSKCKIILWIFSDLIISQLYHKFSHDIRPQQTTSVGSNRVITSYVYQLRFYSINVTDESWIWESHFLIISYQVFKDGLLYAREVRSHLTEKERVGNAREGTSKWRNRRIPPGKAFRCGKPPSLVTSPHHISDAPG